MSKSVTKKLKVEIELDPEFFEDLSEDWLKGYFSAMLDRMAHHSDVNGYPIEYKIVGIA